ncbi:HAD family hydrolase [Acinetobacter pollinis]|uniref:Haloacid dehalogenase-like hydrolase n=1 Tax=Acinetobacter pollinis TaxID=2605270 RepID=A0ABU6DVF1_9GAMM|nr:HAD family hydrolase [Acinetobacter pollinis]MEB5477840.1 haloacid dehalogenase-like hydrolase [Acinetobacter pollinis]
MKEEVVVFDMDGTLFSNDSTKSWITKSLKSNKLRFSGAVLVMPLAVPLMKIKKYKSIGASLFLWVATLKMSEESLKESFRKFSLDVKDQNVSDVEWFKDAINELNNHIESGRKVIVVTAAPEILAQELLESIGIHVTVIGTPLRKKFNGWIGGKHCRHNEKVRRLKLIGINGPWHATYSDNIEDDYPILKNCKYSFLINSDDKHSPDYKLNNLKKLKWF